MPMKNTIMYYYNLDDISLFKMNYIYRFEYKKKTYFFEPLTIDINELREIMNLNFINNKYNKIIGNKEKMPITPIQGQNYVLLKKEIDNYNLEEEIKNTINIKPGTYNLDRSNWCMLWSKKIDYFEYQLNHLEEKYKLISESIDYYIGMAETAISYVQDTINNEKKSDKDGLCICHKRIENNNFYHPFNIVFDHKSRDVSEYLKYLFVSNQYKDFQLQEFLINLDLSTYGYRLLYGRMFYPSFYIDIYDKIINNNIEEKEINNIIRRTEEYENYINRIYMIINNKIKIQKVNWI